MPGRASCLSGAGRPALFAHPAPSLAQCATATRRAALAQLRGERGGKRAAAGWSTTLRGGRGFAGLALLSLLGSQLR